MKRLSVLLAATLATVMGGCSGSPPADPGASADHPANPAALAGSVPPASMTLAVTDPIVPARNPPVSHEHVGPETNDPALGLAEQAPDGSVGGRPAGPSDVPLGGLREPSHQHHEHGVATDSTSTQPSTQPAALYVCPMHPEITSDQPDQRCSICGMKLVKKNP